MPARLDRAIKTFVVKLCFECSQIPSVTESSSTSGRFSIAGREFAAVRLRQQGLHFAAQFGVGPLEQGLLGIYEAFEESQIEGNGVQENLFQ